MQVGQKGGGEGGDVSDDDERRSADAGLAGGCAKGAEGGVDGALCVGAAGGDDRGGPIAGDPAFEERGDDALEARESHEEHEGASGAREGDPGGFEAVGIVCADGGDDADVRGDTAVGDGDAGGCGRGEGAADAGDELDGDAMVAEVADLLAASAEHEGVAALESDDAESGPGGVAHDVVDGALRRGCAAAGLANADEGGLGGEREDIGVYEGVVEDDVGVLESAEGALGEEFGVSGSCSDDGDGAMFLTV